MKVLIFAGVGMLIVVALIWLVVRGNTDTLVNYPPKNPTIVAFGDSLVFGYGSTEGNDFVSILSGKLRRPIVNLGVSGDTTAMALLRMDAVTKLKPGIVLLLLGGNDTLRRVPVATTEENLRKLITEFQRNGSLVVFIGVRGGVLGGGEREDVYERVSEELGALYVPDILKGIILKPELMFDGIHPNDRGYAIIAERLFTILEDHAL